MSFKKQFKHLTITGLSLLSGKPRRKQDILITLYHDTGNSESDYNTSVDVFERQNKYLFEAKVDWLLASECASEANRVQGSNSVCVTFDDGAVTSFEPILSLVKQGGKCTQFIIPERSNIKQANTLSWEQIEILSQQGVEIGSHSLTHPDLTSLSDKELEYELKESKFQIETKLNKSVTSFAYPYGLYNRKVRDAVIEAGYQCAFTTHHLYADKSFSDFELPRFEPIHTRQELEDVFRGKDHLFYSLLYRYKKMDRLIRF